MIIRQGIDEGVFDTKYPAEAAKVTIVSLHALSEVSERFERGMDMNRTLMLFDFIARILGDKDSNIKKFLKKMEA